MCLGTSERLARSLVTIYILAALIEENFSKYPGFAGVLQQYIFFYERELSRKTLQDTSEIK